MLDLNTDFPTGKQDFNPQYEYEEDSDLEDEVDTKEPGSKSPTWKFPQNTENRKRFLPDKEDCWREFRI